MSTRTPLPRQPRTAIGAYLSVVLVAVIASAAGAWWHFSESAPMPLQTGWDAQVRVLAGDGVAGTRDGHVDRAQFTDPFGLAVGADGTVYVADAGALHRIRRITRDGMVSTFAGGEQGFVDGPAASARFSTPSALAIDAQGNIYVADTGNHAVRRIKPNGEVTTLAGDGVAGHVDGQGSSARFNAPVGLVVDSTGRVIVADTYNDRIRAIEANGTVTTLAGSGVPGSLGGAFTEAQFDTPCSVAIDEAGNILVADTGNGLIRAITPGGEVSTPHYQLPDGFFRPIAIAVVGGGDIYVADERGRLLEIATTGVTRVVAGSTQGFRDGNGREAQFRRLSGLAVAGPGQVFVSDTGNALIRLVIARSLATMQLPPFPFIAPRFDPDAFSRQPLLWPVEPMDGPFEIAGTIGEARGSEGAERLHAGIDIRLEQGTTVRAVRDGFVSSPLAAGDFGSLNESLRIGPLSYVHLRAGRDRRNALLDPSRFVPTYDDTGKMTRIRVRRGARFGIGEIVGTVNAFNHVHLNVGWPGEEYNPLQFRLVGFEDTVAPTIARGGVRLYDENLQPLTKRAKGRLVVSGRVQIVVDAWDRVDGNSPNRRLGLHALGYQVLTRTGDPAPGFETPRDTIHFDRLTGDPDAARLVYAPGSGIPFYGRRVTRFLYVVTNTLRDGVAQPGIWDTTLLPPGDYILRVFAADIQGNEAPSNGDVPITIVAPDGS